MIRFSQCLRKIPVTFLADYFYPLIIRLFLKKKKQRTNPLVIRFLFEKNNNVLIVSFDIEKILKTRVDLYQYSTCFS